MNDIEDDFSTYQSVRTDIEGGPHPGRSEPSRGLLVTALAAGGLLVAGLVALLFVG